MQIAASGMQDCTTFRQWMSVALHLEFDSYMQGRVAQCIPSFQHDTKANQLLQHVHSASLHSLQIMRKWCCRAAE